MACDYCTKIDFQIFLHQATTIKGSDLALDENDNNLSSVMSNELFYVFPSYFNNENKHQKHI